MSKKYCENEYILDTKHLLNIVNELNDSHSLQNENIHLFTLDVEKLYPSIKPEFAEEALDDLLAGINEEDRNIGTAVKEFVHLSFNESYITFKDEVFKPKIGIPTGGSLSRQLADIFLHWLLFKKIDQSIMNTEELRFWKRFIDDGIGIWRGTKRAFEAFVKKLNKETNKYGINFPINEVQFGKSVHYLDVTFYIDEQNRIQYRSYTKPTDAKRYLRPQSFHPNNVFKSVPLSQMIRTIERNSIEETKNEEMKKLINDFEKSGYKREELETIEQKARNRSNDTIRDDQDTLTFPLFYFKEMNSFKQVLKDCEGDLKSIIGDTKIIMAIKKNPSIGSSVVRNKNLTENTPQLDSQKCGATNCMQCPLVNTKQTITINNIKVKPSRSLNCKSRNVIYLWECQLCADENGYFGRTIQKSHERTNTHRRCFCEAKWEDSALSMHARTVHGENFDLRNFRITLVKKCSPQVIRREEFKHIDKYRTRTKGINRYKN
jgi:hypothetical protein